MRICMLGFCHDVRDGRVFHREARALAAAGHAVSVIGCGATGRLFRVSTQDGITLYELPRKPVSTRAQLLLDPWRFLWMLLVVLRHARRADALHCHEYQSLVMGWIAARLFRRKLVYDCHEYQPETIGYLFEALSPRLFEPTRRAFARFERFFNRRVDAAVVVSRMLVERFERDCRRVVFLPNYPTLAAFLPGAARPPEALARRLQGRKVIVFLGFLSAARGLNQCLHMLQLLRRDVPEAFLLCVGDMPARYQVELERLAGELGVRDHVDFTGRFEHAGVRDYLALGQVGIYLIQPRPIYHLWSEGTKFFQYAAAGLPVVVSDVPAFRRLIEEVGNGLLVPHDDPAAAAAAVQRLLQDEALRRAMAEKGRAAFETRLNADAVLPGLLALYADFQRESRGAHVR